MRSTCDRLERLTATVVRSASLFSLPSTALSFMSGAIGDADYVVVTRAVRTAVDLARGLHSVPDDATGTVRALRREPVDSAFEAVEGVAASRDMHLKALVVVVAADIANGHLNLGQLFGGLIRSVD
jgi:hypothetical protein